MSHDVEQCFSFLLSLILPFLGQLSRAASLHLFTLLHSYPVACAEQLAAQLACTYLSWLVRLYKFELACTHLVPNSWI